MKKIYNILFTLIAVLSFTSCSNDIDEVFDKPSAERVNDAIAEYKTVLTSAENGWLMKYYPKANTKYGGEIWNRWKCYCHERCFGCRHESHITL